MEDLLEVYHRPYGPRRKLICLDELPVLLIGETRVLLPAAPGRAQHFDFEYIRNSSASPLMSFGPLLG